MNKIYINYHAVSASFITMDEVSKVIPEWMQAKNRFALVGRHDQLPTDEYCYIDAYSGWGASPEDDRTLCSIEFALNARFQEEARYLAYMPEDGDDPAIVAAVNAQLCPLNEEPFTIPTWFEAVVDNGHDPLKDHYHIVQMLKWDMDHNHRHETRTYDEGALDQVVNAYLGYEIDKSVDAAIAMHFVLEYCGFDATKGGGVKCGSMAVKQIKGESSADHIYTCELLLNTEGWHGRDIPVDEDKSDTMLLESFGCATPEVPIGWLNRKRWAGVRYVGVLGQDIISHIDIKTGWGVNPDDPATMSTLREAINAMFRGDVIGIAYVADTEDDPALVENVNFQLYDVSGLDTIQYPCISEYTGPEPPPHIADLLEDTDFELVEDGWAPLDEEDSSQSDPIIN